MRVQVDVVAACTLVQVAGRGAAVHAYGVGRVIIDGDAREGTGGSKVGVVLGVIDKDIGTFCLCVQVALGSEEIFITIIAGTGITAPVIGKGFLRSVVIGDPKIEVGDGFRHVRARLVEQVNVVATVTTTLVQVIIDALPPVGFETFFIQIIDGA